MSENNHETGEIYLFKKYNHIRTDTQKPRRLVVLVPKDITELLHKECPFCQTKCKIYSTPIEKKSVSNVDYPLYVQDYPTWLDVDRYCIIKDSNAQTTCDQDSDFLGKLSKKDAIGFFENLKEAFKQKIISRNLSDDPFTIASIFSQWDDFLESQT